MQPSSFDDDVSEERNFCSSLRSLLLLLKRKLFLTIFLTCLSLFFCREMIFHFPPLFCHTRRQKTLSLFEETKKRQRRSKKKMSIFFSPTASLPFDAETLSSQTREEEMKKKTTEEEDDDDDWVFTTRRFGSEAKTGTAKIGSTKTRTRFKR